MVYKYEHDVINELEELEDEYKINYKNEIDEIRKVYRKAKSFDELVNFYPQKDEIPSDEFFMMMGYIIEGYKDKLKEVHSKAKAFDKILEMYKISNEHEDNKDMTMWQSPYEKYIEKLVKEYLEGIIDEENKKGE